MDGLNDDRLVQLVQQGQPDAFAAIIRRYQRDVTAVVSALLYRRQDTEELVQQVFVNAFTNLASFHTGRDFGSWIRTIARNAVREQLRKQVRYDRRLQVYYEMMAARLDDERTWADDRSREDALRRCLGQLTGKAAEVIRWRYTDSRGVAEIAAAWQTTANAVSKLLGRTRAALRECVEQRMDEA